MVNIAKRLFGLDKPKSVEIKIQDEPKPEPEPEMTEELRYNSEGRTKRLFSDELVLGKRRSGEIVKIRFMDVNNQDPEVKEGLEESYDVEVSYDAGAVIVKGQKEKVRRLIDREFDDLTLDEKKEEFPEAYR